MTTKDKVNSELADCQKSFEILEFHSTEELAEALAQLKYNELLGAKKVNFTVSQSEPRYFVFIEKSEDIRK